jgi:TRAP-type mannitol/chloroaromatic compound transport system permease small subunit
VGQSFSIDEKSADPGGIPHRWVLKAMIPLGFALLALQALAELIRVWTARPTPT